MGATGRFDRDLALAIGAHLGGDSLFDGLFLLAHIPQRIDHFDHQEQDGGDNEEVKDRHNEGAVVE